MPRESTVRGTPQVSPNQTIPTRHSATMPTHQKTATYHDLIDSLSPVAHAPDSDALTVFGIVHNEMFFLPAFLNHYRRLGAQQFLILDDHSDDGSRDYLIEQPDCVVLHSKYRFGDTLPALANTPWNKTTRAGVVFKTIIPQKYLGGKYAVYADADEFLILPPEISSLGNLVRFMSTEGITSLLASLIDFYPAKLSDLFIPREPASFEDLIEAYPYFDAKPLVRPVSGGSPEIMHENNASRRLFSHYKIKKPPEFIDFLPPQIINLLPLKIAKGGELKTPIVHWDSGRILLNSHKTNVPPETNHLIAFAHFKFTFDMPRRIDFAITSKAYGRKSLKYSNYAQLLAHMVRDEGDFLGPSSKIYRDARDLFECQLMHWPK